MRQCESLATRQFVALELPVQPDLVVRTGPRAFLSRANQQSPGGRVLPVAAHIGGRVQITVSDERRRIPVCARVTL